MPAIAVIVPAYNVAHLIGEALDSVLRQTFQDYEIVVVNDGSPDTVKLEQALQPYAGKITYVRQENRGVAGARNTAIRNSSAPFLLILDSDDWLEPDCLSSQYALMQEGPGWDAIYANPRFFGTTRWAGTCWMDHYPSEGEVTFLSVLQEKTCPSNPASIIRREILSRIGVYDEAMSPWEDYDLWLRILQSGGKISYNRKPIVNYRRWESNLSGSAKYCEIAVRVLDKAEAAYRLNPEEREALQKLRQRALFEYHLMLSKQQIRARNLPEARHHLEIALENSRRFNLQRVKMRGLWMGLRFAPFLVNAALQIKEKPR